MYENGTKRERNIADDWLTWSLNAVPTGEEAVERAFASPGGRKARTSAEEGQAGSPGGSGGMKNRTQEARV